jgi:riboflavin synthase alpha subunit/6,7-dimethyl-8-ribityllumazine synthase
MFTGLVSEVGRVLAVTESGGRRRITVAAEQTARALQIGDSVAVSGVCLTAVEVTAQTFSADLAQETWTRTSFSRISPGASINLELPLPASGRLGGHMVQGHVDGIGLFEGLEPIAGGQDFLLHIAVPDELEKYLVFKGSVAVEGISLTVAALAGNRLTIAVIPHTCSVTNLTSLHPGDPVNIETDMAAKYLEKWMHTGDRVPPGADFAPARTKSGSPPAAEGALNARGKRFGIVAARFNAFITDRLLDGAVDALRRLGASDHGIEIVRVPGAWEIPAAARMLAHTGRVDAIVCVGCLIRGETLHYEVIAHEVARALGHSAERTGVPHTLAVLTCETPEQAIDRAGLKAGNKGFEAAMAAVEMASLRDSLASAPGDAAHAPLPDREQLTPASVNGR